MQTTDPRATLAAQIELATRTTGKRITAAAILEVLLTDDVSRCIFWTAVDLVLFLQGQGVEVKRRASDNRVTCVLSRLLVAEDRAREAVRGRPWTERECVTFLLARLLGDDPALLVGEEPHPLAPRRVAVVAEVKPVAVH